MKTHFANPCKTVKIFVVLAKVFSFRKDFGFAKVSPYSESLRFIEGTFQTLVHERAEKTNSTKHYNRSILNTIQVKIIKPISNSILCHTLQQKANYTGLFSFRFFVIFLHLLVLESKQIQRDFSRCIHYTSP